MNLNEDDIRRALENYKDEHRLKDYKIAELCGMSSPSVYNNYKKGKTQYLRADYLLNFSFNAKISLDRFIDQYINKKSQPHNTAVEPLNSLKKPDTQAKIYNCPDCIAKQREIDALRETLAAKEELLDLYRSLKKDQGKCG
ncbi:hypothetical protein [uncultured Sunxiuqinia sp.]|uniref:hypothetical protein n=1 Tax=uncultured Sunxiuqinia sp. TaxID=1573825 RepID=UPI002630FB21|nr:hypothetical protein [uncultured Sunxiuqinia sp.]